MPRPANFDLTAPSKMFNLRLPIELHIRLKQRAALPTETGGMSGIVIRALWDYLDAHDQTGEPFLMAWRRGAPDPSQPPTPWSRCVSYGGQWLTQGLDSGPRFLSPTLQLHHNEGQWGPATWALIHRERRWRREMGYKVLPGLAFDESIARDLSLIPDTAQAERSPFGNL